MKEEEAKHKYRKYNNATLLIIYEIVKTSILYQINGINS